MPLYDNFKKNKPLMNADNTLMKETANSKCPFCSLGTVHMHLIPRYHGDVPNPKGGVRGVIPDRQKY